MKLVLSPRALADLDDIADYIAEDNLNRALAFVAELRKACQGIAQMPEAFPVVAHRRGENLRRRAHRGYLIFYQVTDRAVIVLRVLHGARDWEALLGDQDGKGDG